ncbi:hypothetical protein AA313_de0201918 [Arthrobotrys entomopaga]|nr:hypothetical protein AA313_de0201918 [Arthrobotrys entomopaga]
MAAPIGGDSMLQIPRGQLLFRRRQNSRDSASTQEQLLPRQNGPGPSDGVTFTTLVLTETIVTPSATLTEILTVAPTSIMSPSPQPDRLPSGNADSAASSTPDMTTTAMAITTPTTASSTSNSVHSHTSGSTMVTAPAQDSPTSTPVASSSSSGLNTKVIIPAIVCSAVFLVVVAFLLGYFIRRRKNQRLDPPDRESVVINEIERGGYGAEGDEHGTAGSRRNEKQQTQVTSRPVPNISIEPSPARTRSLSKATSQSKEGLLQSDYTKLGPDVAYAAERERRHAMAMFRRSTAQDSATIPHHLRNLRPESVSTDGIRSPGLHVPDDFELPRPAPTVPIGTDRISKIGMALSTSDKSVQEDNISAIIQEDVRQPAQPRAGGAPQGAHTMFFEETPPLYSVASNSYFGGGSTPFKSNAPLRSEPIPEFETVGSAHSSNKSRFVGRSDIATPSPPATPTRNSQDQDQDTSAGSRRSSRRGSAIFGLAAATLAHAAESSTRRVRPKSWDLKGRKDRRRQSRGRKTAAPAGLEKRKGNKSRSRSRGNVAWTAWFDSSDEGEEDDRAIDVVEPIPLPGGIVTSKSQSQRKKRVIFNSTSDISEHPTVSTSRTRATA